MLKFLTHKLKTHSLNEENHHKIQDDDHDSGTESDDGSTDEISMDSEVCSVATALSRSRSSILTPASPYFLDSALPSDCDQGYDQHSSEEELEVINCKQMKHSTGQEKRKWSQVTAEGTAIGNRSNSVTCFPRSGYSLERQLNECSVNGPSFAATDCSINRAESRTTEELVDENQSSSDDEIVDVKTIQPSSIPTDSKSIISGECNGDTSSPSSSTSNTTGPVPVQFRTSPPRGTHRPHSAVHLVPHEASPRKRHRNAAPPRPCLDFEKMQQLKARAIGAWRHGGDTTGELSVYCW